MYLTQDMEPTEQSAASEQIEILDNLIMANSETDQNLTASGKLSDEDE